MLHLLLFATYTAQFREMFDFSLLLSSQICSGRKLPQNDYLSAIWHSNERYDRKGKWLYQTWWLDSDSALFFYPNGKQCFLCLILPKKTGRVFNWVSNSHFACWYNVDWFHLVLFIVFVMVTLVMYKTHSMVSFDSTNVALVIVAIVRIRFLSSPIFKLNENGPFESAKPFKRENTHFGMGILSSMCQRVGEPYNERFETCQRSWKTIFLHDHIFSVVS